MLWLSKVKGKARWLLNCCLRFAGVALLPFVDERRLLGALSNVYPDLSDLESELATLFFCLFAVVVVIVMIKVVKKLQQTKEMCGIQDPDLYVRH